MLPQRKFLEFARDMGAMWDPVKLQEFSSLLFPDETLSRARSVIRADGYLEWIRWYAEGLVDPRRFTDRAGSYPMIFEATLHTVREQCGNLTADEHTELASAIAQYLL